METTSPCLLCSPCCYISKFSLITSNTRVCDVQTGLGSAGPVWIKAIATDTSVWWRQVRRLLQGRAGQRPANA